MNLIPINIDTLVPDILNTVSVDSSTVSERAIPRILGAEAGNRVNRGVIAAVALLAFALTILRPFCDVAFAAAGPDVHAHQIQGETRAAFEEHARHDPPGGDCCTSVGDWTPVPPLALPAAWMAGETPAAAPRAPIDRHIPAYAHRPARVAQAPPPERSFYARSARILR